MQINDRNRSRNIKRFKNRTFKSKTFFYKTLETFILDPVIIEKKSF